MISFLETAPYWYWLVLAGILLVGEITTGTTYLLWPAVAAFLIGILSAIFPGIAWQIELFIFAGATIVLTIFGTPYVRKWLEGQKTDHENLNLRGAQKIGQKATVEVSFENGKGKVSYGDTEWLAEAETDIEAGTTVEIIDVRGTTFIVKPV